MQFSLTEVIMLGTYALIRRKSRYKAIDEILQTTVEEHRGGDPLIRVERRQPAAISSGPELVDVFVNLLKE